MVSQGKFNQDTGSQSLASMFNTTQGRLQLQKTLPVKDTVDDPSSLDVSPLADMKLDKLAETAGVVVVHSLGVSEGLHDRTAGRRGSGTVNGGGGTSERQEHQVNPPALQERLLHMGRPVSG